VNVKIIEVDGERRRLSLSLKRVEDTDPVQPRADGAESVHTRPNLGLSDEVFAEAPATEPGEDVESQFEVASDEAPTAEADATGADIAPAEDATEEPAEPEAAEIAAPEPEAEGTDPEPAADATAEQPSDGE